MATETVRTVGSGAPRVLRAAAGWWAVAVAAGAFETALAATSALRNGDDTPAVVAAQVAVRVVVFGVAALLVRQLLRGSNGARLTLTALLSVLGLASLLVGPVQWLADGHAVGDAFRDLHVADALFGASRTVHMVAVVVATVLMYRPAANRYLTR